MSAWYFDNVFKLKNVTKHKTPTVWKRGRQKKAWFAAFCPEPEVDATARLSMTVFHWLRILDMHINDLVISYRCCCCCWSRDVDRRPAWRHDNHRAPRSSLRTTNRTWRLADRNICRWTHRKCRRQPLSPRAELCYKQTHTHTHIHSGALPHSSCGCGKLIWYTATYRITVEQPMGHRAPCRPTWSSLHTTWEIT